LAWLNTVPNEKTESRREAYEKLDIDVSETPDCDALYLLDYLFELGITLGDRSIDHSELRSWMNNTGLDLQPWECRFIKQLSARYLSAINEYKEPKTKAPFNTEYFESADRYIQAMKVKNSIRKMVE